MYARITQFNAKPGEGANLSQAMRERGLPMLKQQPGLIDTLALSSDTDPNQFVGVTIWKSKEDAERFLAGAAQQMLQSVRPLLQSEPNIRGFDVQASTMHDVGMGRAASSR